MGERPDHEDDEQLREADRRHHRDVAPVPRDDDADGEGERHHERGADAEQAAAPRAADHQPHSEQRDRHRDAGPRRDRLAERDPGEQRRGDRRHGLHEEDVRDGRVIQRDDERARRDRRADGDAETGDPHRTEHGDGAAAVPDRDEEGQRDEREERAPGELGRRVDGELALQPAGGRPRHRGCGDVQLPPTPAARGNQRFRCTGFVSEPIPSISIVTTSPSARYTGGLRRGRRPPASRSGSGRPARA